MVGIKERVEQCFILLKFSQSNYKIDCSCFILQTDILVSDNIPP